MKTQLINNYIEDQYHIEVFRKMISVSIKTQVLLEIFEGIITENSIVLINKFVDEESPRIVYDIDDSVHPNWKNRCWVNFHISKNDWKKIEHIFDDDFKSYLREKKINEILGE